MEEGDDGAGDGDVIVREILSGWDRLPLVPTTVTL
jgi:hypothetical protein